MHILALATDYDGTIAHDGIVDEATFNALQRLRESGRRLILVTGRALPDLKRVFPALELFDRVVAENGALLYDPATRRERAICSPPSKRFVEALRERNVLPLSVGRSIVATWEPHATTVLEVIRDLGLELQIVFNKGAVMVLPTGINKASGLAAALRELELSPPNVVGVGDAENDHAFLRSCGCSAAVANALPSVKEEADIRLAGGHGRGVAELVEMICRDDALIMPSQRYALLVGMDREGRPASLEPCHGSVLIAGDSGIGTSTLATALTERMVEKSLEFCVLDSQGDYGDLRNAVSIGDANSPPDVQTAIKLLREFPDNLVVNTQALGVSERPAFFASLLPQITALRARTGRPHWLVVDEAHHVLPAPREDLPRVLPENMPATLLVTLHPDAVSLQALRSVNFVIALGDGASDTIRVFCETIGVPPPLAAPAHGQHEVLFWARGGDGPPRAVHAIRPVQTRGPHRRKYAEEKPGEDISFHFRGPAQRLNLRAQNLSMFRQIAQGVDEETWEHHRNANDYSRWFRNVIKDDALADAAAAIESDTSLDAAQSRERIVAEVSRRHLASARHRRD